MLYDGYYTLDMDEIDYLYNLYLEEKYSEEEDYNL